MKRPIARIRPAENRHLNAAVIVFPFDAPVAGVDAVFEYLGWFRHAGSGSTLTVNTGRARLDISGVAVRLEQSQYAVDVREVRAVRPALHPDLEASPRVGAGCSLTK